MHQSRWERQNHSTSVRRILTSATGLSVAVVCTFPIFCTTDIPFATRPKIECFPSRKGVGARVMKNWEPFVSGPELAIEIIPAPVCFN